MFGFKSKNHPRFVQDYLAKNKGNKSEDCIVFDTEASGFGGEQVILSYGYVAVCGNTIDLRRSGEYFIQQEESALYDAATIHQITQINQQALSEDDFYEKVLASLSNHTLVAHVASFDIDLLNAGLRERYGIKLKNKVVDTYSLAIFKEYGNNPSYVERGKFTLDALCQKYDIEIKNRHTALGDALVTAQLYLHLKNAGV